ncbi:FAD-dependent oxidoreductase [Roseomonas elaeocarpi]|uniref:FAD-dependent oxidoreductase n=1 Tax=Roseomonas elaeocarpi TaxID=907779 RepID=A0ABV6JUM0_9PROT
MPDTDIAVIGAGSAGLATALLAAALGRKVTLFERDEPGGRRLHERLPAEALAACARRAAAVREGGRFGVAAADLRIDWAAVRRHGRDTADALRPESGFARLRAMGVEVVPAAAHFASPEEVEAGGRRWRFRRCVVATGSQPALPAGLLGLAEVAALTPATLHHLSDPPGHLLVLGGTEDAVAAAEAHALLGCLVTLVVPGGALLPDHDAEAVSLLRESLERAGVAVIEGEAVRVERRPVPATAGASPAGGMAASGASLVGDEAVRAAEVELLLADGRRVAGTHLLLAVGRVPRLVPLDLAAAGMEAGAAGLRCDRRLRVPGNRRVWVAGSVADPQGTGPRLDAAEDHAGQILRGMLWRLPGGRPAAPARLVGTRAELLQIGETEAAARGRSDAVRVQRLGLGDNGRAVAGGAGPGLVKLVTGPGGRLLGATVLAPDAGEMAGMFSALLGQRLGRLASLPLPPEAVARAARRAAVEFHAPMLREPWLRRWTGFARFLP